MESLLQTGIESAKKMLNALTQKYGERSKLLSNAVDYYCQLCGHRERFSLREKIAAGEYGVKIVSTNEKSPVLYSGEFHRPQEIPMLTLKLCEHEEVLNISLAHALKDITEVAEIAETGRVPSHLTYLQLT